jgi:hypothetical protein
VHTIYLLTNMATLSLRCDQREAVIVFALVPKNKFELRTTVAMNEAKLDEAAIART